MRGSPFKGWLSYPFKFKTVVTPLELSHMAIDYLKFHFLGEKLSSFKKHRRTIEKIPQVSIFGTGRSLVRTQEDNPGISSQGKHLSPKLIFLGHNSSKSHPDFLHQLVEKWIIDLEIDCFDRLGAVEIDPDDAHLPIEYVACHHERTHPAFDRIVHHFLIDDQESPSELRLGDGEAFDGLCKVVREISVKVVSDFLSLRI